MTDKNLGKSDFSVRVLKKKCYSGRNDLVDNAQTDENVVASMLDSGYCWSVHRKTVNTGVGGLG